MTEQIADPAAQEELTGRTRPARLLLGWINQELAERALPTSLHGEVAASVSKARQAVATRSAYIPELDTITPPTPALLEYEEVLRTRSSAQPFFAEGWRVAVADISKMVAMQPHVFLDNSANRVAAVAKGGLLAAAQVALPLDGSTELSVQGDESQLTWLVSSNNPNLRVLSIDGQPNPDRPSVFGFQIGAGASYLQAAKVGDRYVLRDGYHRAVAFLRAGVTRVPAFVREFDTVEGLAPPGMLAQKQFLGERPPFITDYLDDAVSVGVALPSGRKLIVITARELMQIS